MFHVKIATTSVGHVTLVAIIGTTIMALFLQLHLNQITATHLKIEHLDFTVEPLYSTIGGVHEMRSCYRRIVVK